jgi:3'(2'), 5'-bisphosphate nucleotidase
MRNIQEKLDDLLGLVKEADEAVLAVYGSDDFEVKTKSDDSPITRADIASHTILMRGISRLFKNIPIVSEEGDQEANRQMVRSERFCAVDPLDGTREFINRSGHFTVCAAFIEHNIPTYGIVSAPALGVTYYGGRETGSFRVEHGVTEEVHVKRNYPEIVLASRSSLDSATADYIANHYPGCEIRSVGSQLKLPQIAEGSADVYPRLNSPLHIWDLAAGHAILEAAGGTVRCFDGDNVNYQKASLKVGDFIAKNH